MSELSGEDGVVTMTFQELLAAVEAARAIGPTEDFQREFGGNHGWLALEGKKILLQEWWGFSQSRGGSAIAAMRPDLDGELFITDWRGLSFFKNLSLGAGHAYGFDAQLSRNKVCFEDGEGGALVIVERTERKTDMEAYGISIHFAKVGVDTHGVLAIVRPFPEEYDEIDPCNELPEQAHILRREFRGNFGSAVKRAQDFAEKWSVMFANVINRGFSSHARVNVSWMNPSHMVIGPLGEGRRFEVVGNARLIEIMEDMEDFTRLQDFGIEGSPFLERIRLCWFHTRVRESDEEAFMVALGHCHEKQARKVAERLRSDMVSRMGNTYSFEKVRSNTRIPAMCWVGNELFVALLAGGTLA